MRRKHYYNGEVVQVVYLLDEQEDFGHLGQVGIVCNKNDDEFFIDFGNGDVNGWWDSENVDFPKGDGEIAKLVAQINSLNKKLRKEITIYNEQVEGDSGK